MSALHAKFARVLTEVETLVKDQTADAGKYTIRYADINQVLHMLKPVLERHGLVVSQPIELVDGNLMVTTMLIDIETGEHETFPGPAFPVKGDPQAAGGAITYFRRYGLVSLFALEAEDDDGGAAHRQAVSPNARTPAEIETRRLIAAMTPVDRDSFQQDFREAFGSTLTNLPENRHGDALTFTKQWIDTPPAPEPADADSP